MKNILIIAVIASSLAIGLTGCKTRTQSALLGAGIGGAVGAAAH